MTSVLRPRATRTKTGCLPCRARRKKCDERKPVCIGCERNFLICAWKSPQPSQGHSSSTRQYDDATFRDVTASTHRSLDACPTSKSLERGFNAARQDDKLLTQQHRAAVWSFSSSLTDRGHLTALFSTAHLKGSNSRRLFEHYVEKVANMLSGIRGPNNPFIKLVLPRVSTDSMVMDSILAISGAQLSTAGNPSELTVAASAHYALLLRQIKYSLTTIASDKPFNVVNTLLAIIMLSQYESMSGNSQKAAYQHLRASSMLIDRVISSHLPQDADIIGFLVEIFVYLVSVANISANVRSDFDLNICGSRRRTLDSYKSNATYGVLLGSAHDLYELIPEICKLGHERLSGGSIADCPFELLASYKSLEAKIDSWKPDDIADNDDEATQRTLVARLYQQAVAIFLHTSFYGSNVWHPTLTELIDNARTKLLELIPLLSFDSPFGTTLLWPSMIIGSCIYEPFERDLLRFLMLSSPFQVPIVPKALQVLDWLWEEEDPAAYGPYGLGLVMKKHGVSYAMC